MSFDIEAMRLELDPPVQLRTLIQIVSAAGNVPPALKGMAFVALSGMKQTELDTIGTLIVEALGYIDAQDLPGLEAFLIRCDIPEALVEIFAKYASNLVSHSPNMGVD